MSPSIHKFEVDNEVIYSGGCQMSWDVNGDAKITITHLPSWWDRIMSSLAHRLQGQSHGTSASSPAIPTPTLTTGDIADVGEYNIPAKGVCILKLRPGSYNVTLNIDPLEISKRIEVISRAHVITTLTCLILATIVTSLTINPFVKDDIIFQESGAPVFYKIWRDLVTWILSAIAIPTAMNLFKLTIGARSEKGILEGKRTYIVATVISIIAITLSMTARLIVHPIYIVNELPSTLRIRTCNAEIATNEFAAQPDSRPTLLIIPPKSHVKAIVDTDALTAMRCGLPGIKFDNIDVSLNSFSSPWSEPPTVVTSCAIDVAIPFLGPNFNHIEYKWTDSDRYSSKALVSDQTSNTLPYRAQDCATYPKDIDLKFIATSSGQSLTWKPALHKMPEGGFRLDAASRPKTHQMLFPTKKPIYLTRVTGANGTVNILTCPNEQQYCGVFAQPGGAELLISFDQSIKSSHLASEDFSKHNSLTYVAPELPNKLVELHICRSMRKELGPGAKISLTTPDNRMTLNSTIGTRMLIPEEMNDTEVFIELEVRQRMLSFQGKIVKNTLRLDVSDVDAGLRPYRVRHQRGPTINVASVALDPMYSECITELSLLEVSPDAVKMTAILGRAAPVLGHPTVSVTDMLGVTHNDCRVNSVSITCETSRRRQQL